MNYVYKSISESKRNNTKNKIQKKEKEEAN